MKKGYFLFRFFILLLSTAEFLNAQTIPEPQPYLADGSHNAADTGNGYGDSFNSGVSTFLTYPSGNRYLAFGNFTGFNGRSSPGVVRLLDSASAPINPVDNSFKGNFKLQYGFPRKAAFMPNLKILVCGDFSAYGAIAVNQLIRLMPNGDPDFDFQTNLGSGPGGGEITDIKVDPTGNIYLAGSFTTFNGLPRRGLAKLDSTGQLDSLFAGFSGPSGGAVSTIELIPGKILVGGSFTGFNGNISYSKFAIIGSESGSLDSSVPPVFPVNGSINRIKLISGLNQATILCESTSAGFEVRIVDLITSSTISSIAISSVAPFGATISDIYPESGSVIITGDFSQFSTGAAIISSAGIAKLTWSGIEFAGFNAGLGSNGKVNCIVPANSSGFFFLGGDFKRINNLFRGFSAKLNGTTGSTSALSKGSGANGGPIFCSLVMPDNKVILGGDFGYFNWNLRNGITRINSDGTNDSTFNPGTGLTGTVHCLARQDDGKILAGGKFSGFNGPNKNGIVRILDSGLPDPAFTSPSLPMDTVFCIAVQKNDKILVGGSFTDYNGTPVGRIIRLNPDGSPDAVFINNSGTGFNRTVRALAIYKDADGEDSLIFAGGDFSTYKTAVTRRNLAVLDTLGNPLSLGTGIDAGGRVQALAIDSINRQLYAGGLFSIQYNGNTHLNITRMNFGLSPDTSFKPLNGVDGEVFSVFKENGKRPIFLGGKMGLAKAGGNTRGFIKLKPKGSKDLTIGSGNGSNGPVFSIKRDKSGKLILVGNFSKFDSVGKNRLLRMLQDPLQTTVWSGGEWDWDAPDCDFSAIIADRYRKPGFNCKNLFVVQNVKFYPHTQPVEVCGDAFCWSSKIDSAESEVYLLGSTQQQVEGYFRHLSLDNDSGANVYGPTWIDGTLKLWKGTFKTNNFLTLKSTIARTGRLAKVENAASLSGNITLERFVGGGTAGWHFLGTPIKNQAQVHWSDDFLILPTFIYRHNEASNIMNGWEQSNDSLKVGKGFRVFLNQPFFNSTPKFENTGIPHIGNFNFPINFNPGGYGGGGWNLLSNPYPCETDWNQYSRSNVDAQIHYWNGTQYASWSPALPPPGGVNGGSQYIPSSQGFFVKASQAGATLSATEDVKPLTQQNQSFFRTATDEGTDVARITLHSDGNRKDETAIRWMPEAEPWFEKELDADKLENPGLNFFSLCSEGRRASIQARKFNAADSIPLGFSVPASGTYFLEIQMGSWLLDGKSWKIRDNESGYSIQLNAETYFPFQVSEDGLNSPFRFTLIGSGPAVSAEEKLHERKLFAFPNPGKGSFRIAGLRQKSSRFKIQDAGGRVVKEGFTDGQLNLETLKSGIYFLCFQDLPEGNEIIRLAILP